MTEALLREQGFSQDYCCILVYLKPLILLSLFMQQRPLQTVNRSPVCVSRQNVRYLCLTLERF